MTTATTGRKAALAWGASLAMHSDNFKRLLEEACPNHAYPIRHKLKDCDMMKSFMISGSLTRGTELDEDPGGSTRMPFPRDDAVMIVYGGCPPEKEAPHV
jgi:hypothetical protein